MVVWCGVVGSGWWWNKVYQQFIIFIIKSMKQPYSNPHPPAQHHLNHHLYHQITPINKFSFHLPDCSLVLETHQQNQLDTHEMSWLERLPSHEQLELSDSELLPHHNSPDSINQMKFSFNMNYNTLNGHSYSQQNNAFFQRQKERVKRKQLLDNNNNKKAQNNHILKQLQDQGSSSRVEGNGQRSFGSIKNNRKGSVRDIGEYSSSIVEIADNITVNKLQEMNKRLNIALSKEKYGKKDQGGKFNQGKQLNNGMKYSEEEEKEREKKYLSFYEQKQRYQHQAPPISHISNNRPSHSHANTPQPPISLINTSRLPHTSHKDTSKQPHPSPKDTLRQSAFNPLSFTQTIKDRSTLTKINRQNDLESNINKCLEHLFQRLDKSKIGKLNKGNCSIENIRQECKFIFGDIFIKIKLKHFECNKREFIRLARKIVDEIESNQIMDILQKMQSYGQMTKEKPHLQESILASTINHHQMETQNNQRGRSRISSLTVIEPHCYSLQQTLKFNNIQEDKICQCGAFIQENQMNTNNHHHHHKIQQKKFTSQKKVQQRKTTSKTNQKQNYPSYGQLSKNNKKYQTQIKSKVTQVQKQGFRPRSGINRQILRQHKKSIQQINSLNRKIQLCLRSQINSQSNVLEMNQSSLQFSQLVKHI